ncbi:3-oxoacyl-ACP reductase [Pseudonocardia acaciae]|uniref:3-oxoacyl-ACP reductase n=1 Tax=Pseudonocardia acaciae TaxID=551276 RepID=UPI00048C6C4B|nr:3-oxoacyl-ACP reductase [Pseudonocardia acaciae]
MADAATGGSGGLSGRVAVVTGAGAGLGRAEALALAAEGADVVVNDLTPDAGAVVEEIEAGGGKAVLVAGDIAERDTADALVGTALERFGGLHVVVNNAGLVRDRMLFGMSDQEWDQVVRVHLRGHFLLSRNAAAHWREQSKQEGGPVYGRIVNTSSEAFLLGPPGQPNYAAAKAGIVALTVSAARALKRYGVTANAICPRARTAMTAGVFGEAPQDGPDPLSTGHVAPVVAYLASPAAAAINGQVFVVHGGKVALLAPPTVEQRFDAPGGEWTAADLDASLGGYFAGRDPERMFASAEVLDL